MVLSALHCQNCHQLLALASFVDVDGSNNITTDVSSFARSCRVIFILSQLIWNLRLEVQKNWSFFGQAPNILGGRSRKAMGRFLRILPRRHYLLY
jgi:hypothetical protein